MDIYENFIELNMPPLADPPPDLLTWHRYNPRKNINRYGASLTSLDGGDSGIPDLDSLLEFNTINGSKYTESDFRMPTLLGKKLVSDFIERFDCGRAHILRLDQGGFFPFHRDLDLQTFRIIYTFQKCTPHDLTWVQNREVLELQNHRWYYINTKIKHSLFSYTDGAMLAVFNVIKSEKSYRSLASVLDVK